MRWQLWMEEYLVVLQPVKMAALVTQWELGEEAGMKLYILLPCLVLRGPAWFGEVLHCPPSPPTRGYKYVRKGSAVL